MKMKGLFFLALLFFANIIFAQNKTERMFCFGHSLIDHRPPINPTPSDETTIPHWVYLLAQEAGHNYFAGGQYGFLPQHANLPPNAQWGYDIVPGAWDSDFETFADANFSSILITAGNFMQWQGPEEAYPGQGSMSPVSATEEIVDWLGQQEDHLKIYIYENWPDMASYLGNGFPATNQEFANYNQYLNGDFHDWWIEYHDVMVASRPDAEVKMIPVGPIIADLVSNTVLNQIPITELYEDDAPHGRATTYFLAGLITYMAVYQEQAPANYTVPNIVHQIVSDNYAMVNNFIWTALNDFNFNNGDSRVFFETALPVQLASFKAFPNKQRVDLHWRTTSEVNNQEFEIEHRTNEGTFQTIATIPGNGTTSSIQDYHYSHSNVQMGSNYYRLKQVDIDGNYQYSKVISAEIATKDNSLIQLFPNPNLTGRVNLIYHAQDNDILHIKLLDTNGRLMKYEKRAIANGHNSLELNIGSLGNGLFIMEISDSHKRIYKKLMLDSK